MEFEKIENGMNNGWKLVELKELVDDPKRDIVDGPFGSNLKANEYIDTGVPVFKIQNIKANQFIDKNINHISEEKAKELYRHSFKSGDLILTKLGDPLGLCCKVPDKYSYGVIVADLIRLRPNSKKVIDKYLIYAINSIVIQNQFRAITKGTTRPRVNLTIVRSITLALAPLPEQRAIVSKIEQLFSDLDNGIDNFKKAQEQLKIYRQAVLKKAFEGELTKKWREEQTDLPSAEELLQHVKEEREKHYQKQLDGWKSAVKDWEDNRKEGKKPTKPKNPKELPSLTKGESVELSELPDDWCWKHLGDLTDLSAGHAFKKSEYSKEGVKLFQIANVTFGKTIWDNTEYLPKSYMEKWPKLVLKEGDVLLALNRPLLQKKLKICRLESNDLPAILYQRVGRLDFYITGMEDYIFNFMQGIFFSSALEKELQGVNIPFINKGKLLSKYVPICSIQEQHQIVREIETRLSICDKMETTITESLQKAESLRQSILKKAFEGKLLNEKALEEARNAPDWEPAEKLLERIRQEKQIKENNNKPTRRKTHG